MTDAQRETLKTLCSRYNVEYNEDDYKPAFDLPDGYVAGWIGGVWFSEKLHNETGNGWTHHRTIYVGVDVDGRASS